MPHYELTKKAYDKIKADRNLQMSIAIVMDNTYMATHLDLQRNGRAMCANHDALMYLEKHLKLPISQIRKKQGV